MVFLGIREEFVVDIKTMDSYMSATPPQHLWLKYQAQMQLYLDWTNTQRGILFCVQAANPFVHAIAEMIYQKLGRRCHAVNRQHP